MRTTGTTATALFSTSKPKYSRGLLKTARATEKRAERRQRERSGETIVMARESIPTGTGIYDVYIRTQTRDTVHIIFLLLYKVHVLVYSSYTTLLAYLPTTKYSCEHLKICLNHKLGKQFTIIFSIMYGTI